MSWTFSAYNLNDENVTSIVGLSTKMIRIWTLKCLMSVTRKADQMYVHFIFIIQPLIKKYDNRKSYFVCVLFGVQDFYLFIYFKLELQGLN